MLNLFMKNDIKSLFLDVSLLYKNIIHWNLSKILIFLWGIICGFIAIIPFALLFLIFWFFSDISFFTYIWALLNWTYTGSFTWDIIYFLSIWGFILWYFFNFVLLLKLNSSYILWEKLSYKKNEYLNYKLFLRYLLLSILNLLVLLVPILLSILILSLIIFAFWWIAEVSVMVINDPKNIFSIISLLVFIALCILLFYLFYRLIFSYFLLFEKENEDQKIHSLIRKSFNKTSWFKKFIRFFVLIIMVFTIYLPFSIVWTYINWNYEDLNDYVTYISLNDSDKETLKQISSYKYNNLELKYSWLELSDIERSQYKFYYFSIIFSIFKFMIIFWVFSMFLTSFYYKNIRE